MEFATQKHFDMVKKQDMKKNKELTLILSLDFDLHFLLVALQISYDESLLEIFIQVERLWTLCSFSYLANAFILSVLHASDLVLSLILLIGLIPVWNTISLKQNH